jgi:hypothetical protein
MIFKVYVPFRTSSFSVFNDTFSMNEIKIKTNNINPPIQSKCDGKDFNNDDNNTNVSIQ